MTTPGVVVLRAGQVLAGWEAKAPQSKQLLKAFAAVKAERANLKPQKVQFLATSKSAGTAGPISTALPASPSFIEVILDD